MATRNGSSNGVATNGANGDLTHPAKKAKTVANGNSEVTNGVNGTNGTTANGVESNSKIVGQTDLTFLRTLVDMVIKEGLIGAMDRNTKVCDFHLPEDLKSMLSELKIEKGPASDEQLLHMCQDIIKYSVKTANPRFFNQLYGGMDQHTLGGAWVTEALNSSQYTYEVAPVFTLMEKEVYSKMLGFIGFDGGEAIFVPGGSMGNMYGMNVARYQRFPEIKSKGIYCLKKPLCVFTSDKSHYSIKKGAGLMGLGVDNIFLVKTDSLGKMIPEELDQQINKATAEGYEPYFVNATSGTTVLGVYDPLEEISAVCKKHGLWLHVDGAWGGSAVISHKHRHFMKGIDKADSLTWNPHKMMGAPLQCAMFLTKHKGLLNECHSANARYLFQQDKNYDVSYDTGDMSVQCGRKIDVLKLWMLWKGKGDAGMERDIDHLFMLSRYLADRLTKTSGFRLIQEPECTNVCFWYIPPSLQGQTEDKLWWDKLAKVAPAIKAGMMQCGSMMIGYNPDGDRVNFFRMVVSNFDQTTADMDFIVSEIHRLGKDL